MDETSADSRNCESNLTLLVNEPRKTELLAETERKNAVSLVALVLLVRFDVLEECPVFVNFTVGDPSA